MIGQPKYKEGDVVQFRIYTHTANGLPYVEEFTGIVAIVDSYGTFFDDAHVQYDILCKDKNTLYKHILEQSIIKKTGEVNRDQIWD